MARPEYDRPRLRWKVANKDFCRTESGQFTVRSQFRNGQKIAADGYFTGAIMLPEPNITAGIDNQISHGGFRHEFLANPDPP